jgi:hypothetical protein
MDYRPVSHYICKKNREKCYKSNRMEGSSIFVLIISGTISPELTTRKISSYFYLVTFSRNWNSSENIHDYKVQVKAIL